MSDLIVNVLNSGLKFSDTEEHALTEAVKSNTFKFLDVKSIVNLRNAYFEHLPEQRETIAFFE